MSQQAKLRFTLDEWQKRVRDACRPLLPDPHFASDLPVAVTLYYLPQDEMAGDLDNIIKPILDALKQYVIVDDDQVERIVVQKFEPERTPDLLNPTKTLGTAWVSERPILYVRISDNLAEERL